MRLESYTTTLVRHIVPITGLTVLISAVSTVYAFTADPTLIKPAFTALCGSVGALLLIA